MNLPWPYDATTNSYRSAYKNGLPAFPAGIAASTPLNSTPYMISRAMFTEDFGFSSQRRHLLENWASSLESLHGRGLIPLLHMFGGSFLDLANREPNDIDGILIYDLDPQIQSSAVPLRQIQAQMKTRGVDVRLIPAHLPFPVLAKYLCFFSSLYNAKPNGDSYGSSLIVEP